MKNMDDGSEIINANPLRVALTFHVHGQCTSLFFEGFGYIFCNSSDLGKGFAFANDEVVGGSIV